ncbi:SH3 domain-containing protein [Rhizobium puerariae]|uniref:SH3 domain-containing protein n=1 Tax=Rhizobium puerariae TaxID=1585791 RepID=A0ABV6AC66_9HYPH
MTGMRKGLQLCAAAVAACLALALPALDAHANGDEGQEEPALAAGFRKGRVTGFPVPRFVSLKAARAHMRVGPSTDYPASWIYSAHGLPLEITEEYGNWRRVRDHEGNTGWMFAPLLSGNRTAVVGPWMKQPLALRSGPSRNARVVARLAPEVRLNLHRCDGTWCEVSLQQRRLRGSVEQGSLWGVYPGESVE